MYMDNMVFGYPIVQPVKEVWGYVSRNDLRPGDLVRFTGHIGIYIGGGNFVHAPSTGKFVRIDSLSSSYWSKKYICGRRIY